MHSRWSAGILADIEWSDYWPADARVPRLAPEDFEVGARWVCVNPVWSWEFRGLEFRVTEVTGIAVTLESYRSVIVEKLEELPSEYHVPRRCVGPQTRWDFPLPSEDRCLETVRRQVLGAGAQVVAHRDRPGNTVDEVLKLKGYIQSQLALLPNPKDAARAQVLTAKGYRRISNAYNVVARIDRPDWVDVLAKARHRAPADFYVPGQSEPAGNWCDHYRRVYSEDKQTVDKAVAKLVPTSGHDNVGYVPPFKAEIR